jgi:hypothetical protein
MEVDRLDAPYWDVPRVGIASGCSRCSEPDCASKWMAVVRAGYALHVRACRAIAVGSKSGMATVASKLGKMRSPGMNQPKEGKGSFGETCRLSACSY